MLEAPKPNNKHKTLTFISPDRIFNIERIRCMT